MATSEICNPQVGAMSLDIDDRSVLAGSTVLVTGASGFIGVALCRALKNRGARVRAAVRTTAVTLDAADEVVVVGDIGPNTSWTRALDGVAFVVHLAARVHQMGDEGADSEQDYKNVNVFGTRKLVEESARSGVQRLLFVSSVKVSGDNTAEGSCFREGDPPSPSDAYGRSKRDAERAVMAASDASDMECVIVRPTLVYGPGVRGNFLTLLKVVRKGWPLPVGMIKNSRSIVYLENLVDAVCRCLEHPAAAGRIYFIRDAANVSTLGLIRIIAEQMGNKPWIVPVSLRVLRFAARHTGREAALCRVSESLEVDLARIQEDLGWSPPYSTQHGVAETVRWFERAIKLEKARR